MDSNTDPLLALICLRVLADTAHGCSWIATVQNTHLAARFRILGIAEKDILACWRALTLQNLVEEETASDATRIRLTPLGYMQSQMPYTPEHPPCTWYERVVHHLYTAYSTPERQVTP